MRAQPGGAPEPEEAWEADVAAALGGLPMVDPPQGFLTSAVDHRPLHAGRTVAAWAVAAAVGLGAAAALGAPDDASVSAGGSGSDTVESADGLAASLGSLRSPTFADLGDGLVGIARQLGFSGPDS